MEVKEHPWIAFHIGETFQNGMINIVTTHIILFVRVISVSKIQQLCYRFIPPSIYNNGCCIINSAYLYYDIAIIVCQFLKFCQFLIFFAQIQIHLAYLFTLCKTKTSIGDIY